MGFYFTKCTKCGFIGWFCSVDLSSSTCKCGSKYRKICNSDGDIIE